MPCRACSTPFLLWKKRDGAGIQILIRPADPSWRKTANTEANAKKEGQSSTNKGSSVIDYASQLATAFVKPPESTAKDKSPKELSSLDQSVIDSMHDKTRSQDMKF